jgi:hypothetical protein
MFNMRGQGAVSRSNRPPVVEGGGPVRSDCDERFNGEDQPFGEFVAAAPVKFVWNRGPFMDCSADSVSG